MSEKIGLESSDFKTWCYGRGYFPGNREVQREWLALTAKRLQKEGKRVIKVNHDWIDYE
jgi:hypothetical protein